MCLWRNNMNCTILFENILPGKYFLFKRVKIGKITLSLCLISWEPRHENMLWRWGVAPSFSTSAVNGSEWSASRSCRYALWESVSGTHFIGCWVNPIDVLDAVERRKSLSLGGNRSLNLRNYLSKTWYKPTLILVSFVVILNVMIRISGPIT